MQSIRRQILMCMEAVFGNIYAFYQIFFAHMIKVHKTPKRKTQDETSDCSHLISHKPYRICVATQGNEVHTNGHEIIKLSD